MRDIILESLNKIRALESRTVISEALTPEEQKELDALAKELEPNMGRLPELDNLLLQHQKLASAAPAAGQAAQPAAQGGAGMLRRGSKGPEVEKLQKDLGMQQVDGQFGPATEKAVKTFQQTMGLQVDGIVGPNTLAAIEKSKAAGADGSDAKSGAPAGNQTDANQSDAETKRLATANAAAGQPAQAGQAAQPAGDATATLAQKVPNPKQGQEYWVNGTRYQYLPTGKGGAMQWKPNMKAGDWGWNWNQWAARTGFTGDQSEVKTAMKASGTATAKAPGQQQGQAAQPAAQGTGTAPAGTSVSDQQSSTTQQGSTTTTNSSATIKGLDMNAARQTPEYQEILKQSTMRRGGQPSRQDYQAADMKYKSAIASGKIKPPAGGAAAPATTGQSKVINKRDDF